MSSLVPSFIQITFAIHPAQLQLQLQLAPIFYAGSLLFLTKDIINLNEASMHCYAVEFLASISLSVDMISFFHIISLSYEMNITPLEGYILFSYTRAETTRLCPYIH
jgi:hypothetical protein